MNPNFGDPWTPREDAILRKKYTARRRSTAAKIAKELNRTRFSVLQRACRLRLTVYRKWTPADERRLAELWGAMSTRQIAKRLGRTPDAVYGRAQQNGVIEAERADVETLNEAARRTGYTRQWLIHILRRAGVINVSVSRCSRAYKMRNYYALEKADVDEAVTSWVSRESLGAAAKRIGWGEARLANALKRIGVTRPAELPRGCQWRIDDATIRRAVHGSARSAA